MLSIVVSMVVIVVLAGLVVTFVAFPHRGEQVPGASWLGDSLGKARDVLPTLDNTAAAAADEPAPHQAADREAEPVPSRAERRGSHRS